MFQNKYLRIEFLFFYLLLVFNLINIWSVDIYTTLDGPSHLYNSSLLNKINTSSYLQEYYAHNNFFLPNYFSHFILAKLILIFNPFVAEKLLLSFIVVFLPISFKYAVKCISGKENAFSFLIFTMVFTYLFHLGFFNFCFAFVLLNCKLIIAYHFLYSKSKILFLILFAITNIILFYTHPFIFGTSMLLVFLYISLELKFRINEIIKTGGILLLVCIPTLVFFIVFILNFHIGSGSNEGKDITIMEKITGLAYFRPTVSFSAEKELSYAISVAVLILLLIVFIISNRILNRDSRFFKNTDLFLILSAITIICVFITKDSMLGDMLARRLSFLFFYFIIFWIACSNIKSNTILFVSSCIIIVMYLKLSFYRHEVLNHLSEHARDIYGASFNMKEKSTLHSINWSNNWLEAHFNDYAVINKEIVSTDNYEAILGWFPIKWRKDKIPKVSYEIINNENKDFILPNYVLIYGYQERIDLPENGKLKKFLNENSIICYQSSDKYCQLFKINKSI